MKFAEALNRAPAEADGIEHRRLASAFRLGKPPVLSFGPQFIVGEMRDQLLFRPLSKRNVLILLPTLSQDELLEPKPTNRLQLTGFEHQKGSVSPASSTLAAKEILCGHKAGRLLGPPQHRNIPAGCSHTSALRQEAQLCLERVRRHRESSQFLGLVGHELLALAGHLLDGLPLLARSAEPALQIGNPAKPLEVEFC